MKGDFESALDECLTMLQAGGDLEACLARHLHYAPELRPLVQVAAAMREISIPEPQMSARVAGRQRLLEAVARRERTRRSKSIPNVDATRTWRAIKSSLAWLTHGGLVRPLAVAAMVTVIAVSAITTSSSASLPGDTLYPVKQGMRETRLVLTFDPSARQQLEEQFNTQQREEVHFAMQNWRRAKVEFKGHLRQIEPSHWVVDNLPVSLDPETAIVGQPQPGAKVAVQGYLPGDGSLVAISLAVAETEPAPSGGQPSPTATPPLASAQPTRRRAVEASETATIIDALGPTHKPTPTCTLTPSVTPSATSLPSATPSRTARPKPTMTAVPSDTPVPTPSRETGGGRPKPSVTPTSISLPSPTSTPSPTQSPAPTDTATPTDEPTVEPTEPPASTPGTLITPDLTATSEAIRTAAPPQTPTREETPAPGETPTATPTPEPGR